MNTAQIRPLSSAIVNACKQAKKTTQSTVMKAITDFYGYRSIQAAESGKPEQADAKPDTVWHPAMAYLTYTLDDERVCIPLPHDFDENNPAHVLIFADEHMKAHPGIPYLVFIYGKGEYHRDITNNVLLSWVHTPSPTTFWLDCHCINEDDTDQPESVIADIPPEQMNHFLKLRDIVKSNKANSISTPDSHTWYKEMADDELPEDDHDMEMARMDLHTTKVSAAGIIFQAHIKHSSDMGQCNSDRLYFSDIFLSYKFD